MISQRAKTGFEKLFPQYLENALRTGSHSSWRLQTVNAKKIISQKLLVYEY